MKITQKSRKTPTYAPMLPHKYTITQDAPRKQ